MAPSLAEELYSDPLTEYARVLVEARTHVASAEYRYEQQQQEQRQRRQQEQKAAWQDGGKRHGGKSWAARLLSFLKRGSKKRHEGAKVIPVQEASRVRSRTKSAPLPVQQRSKPRESSGPLYTDGSPLTPVHRCSRPRSGPLICYGAMESVESPYVPLHRQSKMHSGPVYVS